MVIDTFFEFFILRIFKLASKAKIIQRIIISAEFVCYKSDEQLFGYGLTQLRKTFGAKVSTKGLLIVLWFF